MQVSSTVTLCWCEKSLHEDKEQEQNIHVSDIIYHISQENCGHSFAENNSIDKIFIEIWSFMKSGLSVISRRQVISNTWTKLAS